MKLSEFTGTSLVGQLVLINNYKIRKIISCTKTKIVVKLNQDPNDARIDEWSIKTNKPVGFDKTSKMNRGVNHSIEIITEAQAIIYKLEWDKKRLTKELKIDIRGLLETYDNQDVLVEIKQMLLNR